MMMMPPTADARIGYRLSDFYLRYLLIVLAGYVMMGKGFAYLGAPPLFVGELALLSGALVFFLLGSYLSSISTWPGLILTTLLVWTLIRTLPFIGTYGFDALRDSVLVVYGAFAFIVVSLVLEDVRRINVVIRYFAMLSVAFIFVTPITFSILWYSHELIPRWPGTPILIVWLKPGDVAVHLAGLTVFLLAGFGRPTLLRAVFMIAIFALISAASRSAMISFALPVMVGCVLLGRTRELIMFLVAASGVFIVWYVLEVAFLPYVEPGSTLERSISARQIVENLLSVFGQSGTQTEDTKLWRLYWWEIIIKDTIFGPNFWTGRGFGINLSIADGFQTTVNEAPLRSPHNAHMTMLARAGVPGLFLWAMLMVTWFTMIGKTLLSTWRYRAEYESRVLIFTGCYVLAMLINSTFDVALEGPMQGIWFWCMMGFGIAQVLVWRIRLSQGISAP